MDLPLTDPAVQAAWVGMATNGAGAAATYFLWLQNRGERYLLLWAIGWSLNTLRWSIHFPAESMEWLRYLEIVIAQIHTVLLTIGAYDAVPKQPLRTRWVALALTALMLASVAGIALLQHPEMFAFGFYAFATVILVWQLSRGYLQTRLTGYAWGAFAYVVQGTIVVGALLTIGADLRNFAPLPGAVSIAVVGVMLMAVQREHRTLLEAEKKRRMLFDTAPIPIALVHAPDGIVEESNQAARTLLELPYGRTTLDTGVAVDPARRQAMYDRLKAGEQVKDWEMQYRFHGDEVRTYSVSADRLALDDGMRYIFALHDVTELRLAQQALRMRVDELAMSEERFSKAFEFAPLAIVLGGLANGGTIKAVNPAFERLSGYPAKEVIGRNGKDFDLWVRNEDRERWLDAMTRHGRVTDMLAEFRKKDGTIALGQFSAAIVPTSEGPGFISVTSDITEMVAAQRRELASRATFQTVFETSSEPIAITRLSDNTLVQANEAWERATGRARATHIGLSPTTFNLWARLEERGRIIETLTRQGRVADAETQFVRPDGSVRDVLLSSAMVTLEGVPSIVWAWRDITERKRMERLLIDTGRGVSAEVGDAFFKSLVLHLCKDLGADYAFVGEIVAPANTHIKTIAFVANGEARPNFEYLLEGSPCANAITQRGTVAYPAGVAAQFPKDDGLRRLGVEGYVGTSLGSASGMPQGIMVVMSRRPIQEAALWTSVLELFAARAAAEIQRAQAEAEVRNLNLSLERKVNERTTELASALREIDSFSHTVSHDLRAPLRHITGFIDVLREDYGPTLAGDAMKYFERIERGAQRMSNLIDDLLELSKAGRESLKLEATAMNPIVDAVTEELRHLWATSAKIRVSDLPPARCDSRLIRQVWQNLIGNALKYSSKVVNPEIDIDGRRVGDWVEYAVKDNGAGFDMAYADKLFGAFQRLHGPSEFEGTGIGLATVQRIVHRHGGAVSAQGMPGAGATFTFRLPAA